VLSLPSSPAEPVTVGKPQATAVMPCSSPSVASPFSLVATAVNFGGNVESWRTDHCMVFVSPAAMAAV
jgi:hypothetical protein